MRSGFAPVRETEMTVAHVHYPRLSSVQRAVIFTPVNGTSRGMEVGDQPGRDFSGARTLPVIAPATIALIFVTACMAAQMVCLLFTDAELIAEQMRLSRESRFLPGLKVMPAE